MKNREKYKAKIIKMILEGKTCDFIEDFVFPQYIDGKGDCEGYCQSRSCESCSKLFAFWLDEEYTEPPKPEVDWSKVPVDTLVRVRNRESEDWRLMYFKELRTDYVFKMHITWKDGKTSKTAEGDCVGWQYCELVEDEDDGSN